MAELLAEAAQDLGAQLAYRRGNNGAALWGLPSWIGSRRKGLCPRQNELGSCNFRDYPERGPFDSGGSANHE